MNKCHTLHCSRQAVLSGAYCQDCTTVVWKTGRPPELPVKFVPQWLKRLTARDETGRMVA